MIIYLIVGIKFKKNSVLDWWEIDLKPNLRNYCLSSTKDFKLYVRSNINFWKSWLKEYRL